MSRFKGVEVFHAGPAQLAEGICWHEARQTLWWVDILGQRLFEADAAGQKVRSIACPQVVSALAPTRDGRLVGALSDGIYLLEPDSGALALFSRPPEHDPARCRFNDAKVDPAGRFWAGTMARDGAGTEGRLYRFDGDGSNHAVLAGVGISNGLAWSQDADTLYYIDSPTRAVQAFSFEPATGTLGAGKVALRLAEADGLPDGCAMDAEGHLWIAHWGGGKVTRWDLRKARQLGEIRLPVPHVTSCAFGGSRRDQLYITTAKGDEPATALPEAGWVFRADPGTVGPALPCFAAGC